MPHVHCVAQSAPMKIQNYCKRRAGHVVRKRSLWTVELFPWVWLRFVSIRTGLFALVAEPK